jgi:integrase
MSATTWQTFRERYDDEFARHLRPATRKSISTAFNQIESLLHPNSPAEIKDLHGFFRRVTKTVSRDSAMTYCKRLKEALHWAHRRHMTPHKAVEMPDAPRNKRRPLPKEPLTHEQIALLVEAAGKVSADAKFMIQGLQFSGMRIQEAETLKWDSGPHRIQLLPVPYFVVHGSADKAHRDRELPMTTEFLEHIMSVPQDERSGYVFMPKLQKRSQMRTLVASIGEAAKESLGRAATAHDYRRTFASAWALQVEALVLQKLMRHDSLTTTLRYYVRVRSSDVAKKIQGVRAFG